MKAICALIVMSCLVLLVPSSCNSDIVAFLLNTENDQAEAGVIHVGSALQFPDESNVETLDFTKELNCAELFVSQYWDCNDVKLATQATKWQKSEAFTESLASSADYFSSTESIELELWNMQAKSDARQVAPSSKLRKAKRIVDLKR